MLVKIFRLGSARAINRCYISDCVPVKLRMQASAAFVSASALGMASGPAVAFLQETDFKINKFTFNKVILSGWVMATAWFIHLLLLWLYFREPSHDPDQDLAAADTSNRAEHPVHSDISESLLLSLEPQQEDEDEDSECDGEKESPAVSRKPVTSIWLACRLLTPSLKVQQFVYFMLKYVMEALFAGSGVITTYYFSRSTGNVSIFLACLGLTVLPVNVIVGSYMTRFFKERQVLLASEIMCHNVYSALITFVFAEVLEGVNLSLLSRIMSSRLSQGTYNAGLLSTEAGTLARAFADVTLTLVGFMGQDKLLNITLFSSLILCIPSIIGTYFIYNSLY
ncbi:hypothetical protein RJ641_016858 [Dillenia turbinata]|uniref:Uncharacterized protein n=1 Tax=Dillenia turbinata TaxID=194707 RepID=A0AAN8YZ26_9MAGN